MSAAVGFDVKANLMQYVGDGCSVNSSLQEAIRTAGLPKLLGSVDAAHQLQVNKRNQLQVNKRVRIEDSD